MKQFLQTVVESLEFSSQAKKCMEHSTKIEFINYIAANPMSGNLMQGTGGARKIRWGSDKHKGKSGGVRIIYYYHNYNMPIFLFTVYPKNEKDNLTDAERNELKSIIKELVKAYNK